LVFYLPDQAEWEAGCARMLAAGFNVSPRIIRIGKPRGRRSRISTDIGSCSSMRRGPCKGKTPYSMALQPRASSLCVITVRRDP
jgi:hypothetical protein